MDHIQLSSFLFTFFVISISPGLCMTLALSLGIKYGIRGTIPMMGGELIGVATVAAASVYGVASFMLAFPDVFNTLKVLGGLYLIYSAIKYWKDSEKINQLNNDESLTKRKLFAYGLTTALANPKGWAFMVAVLPPFLSTSQTIASQLSVLVPIILFCELTCMMIYASGGKVLQSFLFRKGKAHLLNKMSATVLLVVGVWLLTG